MRFVRTKGFRNPTITLSLRFFILLKPSEWCLLQPRSEALIWIAACTMRLARGPEQPRCWQWCVPASRCQDCGVWLHYLALTLSYSSFPSAFPLSFHHISLQIGESKAGAVLSKSATLVKQKGNDMPRYQTSTAPAPAPVGYNCGVHIHV